MIIDIVSAMKKYLHPLLLCLTLFVFLFLRLYRFSDLTWFWPDQAVDLLVARRLVNTGVWPLVGPYLSINSFSVPPTYFYILSLFYWIAGTPEGTALGFVVLELFSLLFLYLLARTLWDVWFGVIVIFLYSISTVMISHARSMWQPHPVMVFLIASLWLLAKAKVTSSTRLYGASLCCYAIACSIYPSPVVLLPFYLYHGARLFRSKLSGIRSYIPPLLYVALSFCIVSLPLLWFEVTNGFPTLGAIGSGAFGNPVFGDAVRGIGLNVFGFFDSVLWFSVLWSPTHPVHVIIFILLLITLVVFLMRYSTSAKIPHSESVGFLRPEPIIVGIVSMVWYLDMHASWWPWHRLYGFLPLFFLLFGLIIRHVFVSRRVWFVMPVIILTSLYVYANISTSYSWLTSTTDGSDAKNARKIADAIHSYTTQNHIVRGSVTVVGSDKFDQAKAYIVYPEMYFLWQQYGWVPEFNEFGNKVLRGGDKRYIVLICKIPMAQGATSCMNQLGYLSKSTLVDIVPLTDTASIFIYHMQSREMDNSL